ncbi:hypothetical protein B484DRAFT_427698 [Ochromonadaceae sp. CCMP2298]|nr:hypothetical protein B484DRAFT_427698 [Ochromonadaceae sp. CCMP2298]
MNISKAELTVLKQLLATKDQEIQALKTEAGSVQSKGSDGSMNISKAELALLKNLLATKEQQIQALKTAASDSIFRSPIRPPRSPGGSVARDDRAQSQGSDGSMVISKAELTVLKQLLATKNEEIQALRAGAYDDSPPSSAQSNGRGPWSPRQDMEDAFAAADVREMIAANAELTKQFVNMTGNMRVMAQELAQAQANETKTAKRIRGLIAHVAELRRRAAFN